MRQRQTLRRQERKKGRKNEISADFPPFLLPHTVIGLPPPEINLLIYIGKISHTRSFHSSATKGEEKACQTLLPPLGLLQTTFLMLGDL